MPVYVSRATAEFAAPEIANMESVGFYTDMWAVGVLAYVLYACRLLQRWRRLLIQLILSKLFHVYSLSGLSPFSGDTDEQTLANVGRCDWDYDADSFASVSDLAKDFIRKLLIRSGP